jgi:hypothetical protein
MRLYTLQVGFLSTALMAAFDASASVFFGLSVAADVLSVSLRSVFLAFSLVPIVHMFSEFFLFCLCFVARKEITLRLSVFFFV